MPISLFSDDCPGCRPAAMDSETGKVLSDDHPLMKALTRAWARTTLAQRKAWHAVTCLNSKDPLDLALARSFMNSIENADTPDH